MRSIKPLAAVLLTLLWAMSLGQGGKDHAAELKSLKEQWQKDYQAFLKPFEAMKTDEERGKFDWSKDPSIAYRAKAKNLADKAKGTAAGEESLAWLWQLSMLGEPGVDSAKYAVAQMVELYPQSEQLARMVGQLAYSYPFEPAEARGTLRRILAKSKSEKVQLATQLSLARNLMSGSDAEKAEGRKLFSDIVAKHPGTPTADSATASLFELDNLQVGKVAPDFETVDETGKPWKLSDYRGKVVVLTFWGFW